MVGDASEGLQADDVVHSAVDQADDVGRQKPSFSELCGQRNGSFDGSGFIKDVGEGTEVTESCGDAVDLLLAPVDESVNAFDDEVGHS